MDASQLSPMMRQYLEIKQKNKDNILFFRLGDFYEMFFDDAKIASEELDLVLTGKDCGTEERAPMCGVPYHSCEAYIARLMEKGYKVAICEQVEDPATAKGIVKRDVVRIITPGTVIEDSMLDESKNNYLACISLYSGGAGICFIDISTGTAKITQFSGENVDAKLTCELGRYGPRELLMPKGKSENHPAVRFAKETLNAHIEFIDPALYERSTAKALLMDYFSVTDLSEKGLDDQQTGCITALCAAIRYLGETQMNSGVRIQDIQVYTQDKYMRLDIAAIRNLELCETIRGKEKRGSLLWVLDKTKSPMGKRLIRAWVEQPLMDIEEINRRLDAVSEFTEDTVFRSETREYLTGMHDIERLATRILYGTTSARELVSLKETLLRIPYLKDALKSCKSELLVTLYGKLDTLEDIANLIETVIVDEPPATVREGGIIKVGYDSELDLLRGDLENGKDFILEIEKREREATGIKNLKIRYNKVFGYYIEVSNSFLSKVPDRYIRKQTLTTCERFITDELKDLEARVLGARERSTQLEYQIFSSVCAKVAGEIQRIQDTAVAIAQLDVLASFAESSVAHFYVRPQLNTEGLLQITDGRHPVVEAISKQPFVPNDTLLDMQDNRCAIITGPNMAGKSTYMRQVALINIMAQIGCFVPARSAIIPITDAVFTRVGASDDLSSGKSTFMVEMSEVAGIVQNATKNSLLILDEIGRGTSTYDGMSIARAVLEYVSGKQTLGAKTLFATHYHELTNLEGTLEGVKNYNIAAKKSGDDLIFLRRIVRGGADESYGIEVAKLSGISDTIITRAKAILKELEDQGFKAPQTESATATHSPSDAAVQFLLRLQKMDANTVTPIEALSVLAQLIDEAKSIQI